MDLSRSRRRKRRLSFHERDAATAPFILLPAIYKRDRMALTDYNCFDKQDLLGDALIASAIQDRLLHHSHLLNNRGESYPPREKRHADLFPSQ